MDKPREQGVDVLFLIIVLGLVIGLFVVPGALERVGQAGLAPAGESYIFRLLPLSVREGDSVPVSLHVEVRQSDKFVLVDELVPLGFSISNPGTGNTDEPGHIKWIILNETGSIGSRVLSYELQAPGDNGTYSFYGNYTFQYGTGVFDVSGQSDLLVNDLTTNCSAVDYLIDYNDDGRVDTVDQAIFTPYWLSGNLLADADGNGVLTSNDTSCFGKYWDNPAFPPSTPTCELECTACRILSLDIVPVCDSQGCLEGDSVRVLAGLGVNCSDGSLEVSFEDSGLACRLASDGNMPPVVLDCFGGVCDGFWTIPEVAGSCGFANVSMTNASYSYANGVRSIAYGSDWIKFGNASILGTRILPSLVDEGSEFSVNVSARSSVLVINDTIPDGFEVTDLAGSLSSGPVLSWNTSGSHVYKVRAPSVDSDTSYSFVGNVLSSEGMLYNLSGNADILVLNKPVIPTGGSGGGGGGGGGGGTDPNFNKTSGLRTREFDFGSPVEKVIAHYSGYTTIQMTLSQKMAPDTELAEYYSFALNGNVPFDNSDVVFVVDEPWLYDRPGADVSLYYLRGSTPIKISTREIAGDDGSKRFTAKITAYGDYLIAAVVPPRAESPAPVDVVLPVEPDTNAPEPTMPPPDDTGKSLVFLIAAGVLVVLLTAGVFVWRRGASHSMNAERLSLLQQSYGSAFEYARSARNAGASDEMIRAKFLGSGWSPDDVDLVLAHA